MKVCKSILITLLLISTISSAQIDTNFTYQGSLKDSNGLATGSYDFEFSLWTQLQGGTQIENTIFAQLQVSDGIFTTQLDFGNSPYDGSDIFLEIALKQTKNLGAFTTLFPRQKINSVPYALKAESVSPNSIGSNEIDDTQVQQRISQGCSTGQYISSINQDGSVNCVNDSPVGQSCPNGQVLSGFDVQGNVLCTISTPGDQACNNGQVVSGVDANGNIVCKADNPVNQSCESGKFIKGFDANGNVICGNPLDDPECDQIVTGSTSLTDANRNIAFTDPTPPLFCDNSLSTQWYHFELPAGTQMSETPPAINACATNAPGWLNGAHPRAIDGKVNRQACFNHLGGTCQWSTDIEVVQCDSKYYYKLISTPACFLRYCAE